MVQVTFSLLSLSLAKFLWCVLLHGSVAFLRPFFFCIFNRSVGLHEE